MGRPWATESHRRRRSERGPCLQRRSPAPAIQLRSRFAVTGQRPHAGGAVGHTAGMTDDENERRAQAARAERS